jgi:hypothetical protein
MSLNSKSFVVGGHTWSLNNIANPLPLRFAKPNFKINCAEEIPLTTGEIAALSTHQQAAMKMYWTTKENAVDVDITVDEFAYERVCRLECAAGYRNRFSDKKVICTEDSVSTEPRICGFSTTEVGSGATAETRWKEGSRSGDTGFGCSRMVRTPQKAADCGGTCDTCDDAPAFSNRDNCNGPAPDLCSGANNCAPPAHDVECEPLRCPDINQLLCRPGSGDAEADGK